MIITVIHLLALIDVSTLAVSFFTHTYWSHADCTHRASTALEAGPIVTCLVVTVTTGVRDWILALAFVGPDIVRAVCFRVTRIRLLYTFVQVLCAILAYPACVAHAHGSGPFRAGIPVPTVAMLFLHVRVDPAWVFEFDSCGGLISHLLLKDTVIDICAGYPISLPPFGTTAGEATRNVDTPSILVAVMGLQYALIHVPVAIEISIPFSAVAGVAVHAIYASVFAIVNGRPPITLARSMITAWVRGAIVDILTAQDAIPREPPVALAFVRALCVDAGGFAGHAVVRERGAFINVIVAKAVRVADVARASEVVDS